MNMKKILAFALCLVLVAGLSIAGTVAYLTAQTTALVNTFTVGDINIDLEETTGNTYHIVPGKNIEKDPFVTVKANSEACWLFVKVTENNWSDKLTYTIDDAWTKLENGVYYMAVANSGSVQEFAVLENDTIVVSSGITKGEITAQPTLTFKAYAIQQEGFADNPTGAWNEVKD